MRSHEFVHTYIERATVFGVGPIPYWPHNRIGIRAPRAELHAAWPVLSQYWRPFRLIRLKPYHLGCVLGHSTTIELAPSACWTAFLCASPHHVLDCNLCGTEAATNKCLLFILVIYTSILFIVREANGDFAVGPSLVDICESTSRTTGPDFSNYRVQRK